MLNKLSKAIQISNKIGRCFSNENTNPQKKREVPAMTEEFDEFKRKLKIINNSELLENNKTKEKSLARVMECYENEIRLELFFLIQDEEGVYIESVFNYLGIFYRMVNLSEQ